MLNCTLLNRSSADIGFPSASLYIYRNSAQAIIMQNPDQSFNPVRYVTVSADQAGQRIDNFLITLAQSVPKSHIYRIIRTGQVRANGGRVKPTYRLCENDAIRIPPMLQQATSQVAVPEKLVSQLEQSVLFENDEIIVINKPAGLAVHAGGGMHFGVIEAFRQSRKHLETRLELVHRLDRGTSGCLILAKSRRAAVRHQQFFRERAVLKRYTAIVSGHWPKGSITLTQALKKNVDQGGERKVIVDPAGKPAVSHVRLLRYLGSDSEVCVEIETGRTHQIRVHTAHQGHPVVGDSRYGSNDTVARHRRLGLKRMYLHCSVIAYSGSGDQELTAPLDSSWLADINHIVAER